MKLDRGLLALPALFVASAAFADPVTVDSCYGSFTYDTAPTRAVTLNQQATEVMLALGLESAMAGTAYIDDAIPDQWLDAYATVPILAEKYPAREVVMAAEPDFLFAGFSSAFSEKNLGTSEDWQKLGIGTYLADGACKAAHPTDEPLTIQPILTDIEAIGKIFRVDARADALVAATRARLDAVSSDPAGAGQTAFYYDSGEDTPYSIGCCGGPALSLRLVGLDSITEDVEGSWADVSWEKVVAANPDVIVLNDADWSTAAEKIAYLENDPVLSTLDAVKARRFVTITFSQTLLGMRFADGVESLNAQLATLD